MEKKIPEPQIERLEKLARKRDVSMSELVRRAIEVYLKREEKKLAKMGR